MGEIINGVYIMSPQEIQYQKDYQKEYYRKYREQNRNKIIEINKKSYEKNKSKHKILCNEYKQKNREKIREYQKQYDKEHKDEINKRNREKITCECGCLVSRKGLLKHKQTKKHFKLIESKTINEL